jgi:agmatinase
VYDTFDIDGLDSAVMPATGTPVPGGLSYLQALAILRRTAEVSTIVGADVVELAPISGLHHCDYTAAALAYKIMSYALLGTRPHAGQGAV